MCLLCLLRRLQRWLFPRLLCQHRCRQLPMPQQMHPALALHPRRKRFPHPVVAAVGAGVWQWALHAQHGVQKVARHKPITCTCAHLSVLPAGHAAMHCAMLLQRCLKCKATSPAYPEALPLCALWPHLKLLCNMHDKDVGDALALVPRYDARGGLAGEGEGAKHGLLQPAAVRHQLKDSCMLHWKAYIPSSQPAGDATASWVPLLASSVPRTPASSTVSRLAAYSSVSSSSQPPCGGGIWVQMLLLPWPARPQAMRAALIAHLGEAKALASAATGNEQHLNILRPAAITSIAYRDAPACMRWRDQRANCRALSMERLHGRMRYEPSSPRDKALSIDAIALLVTTLARFRWGRPPNQHSSRHLWASAAR